jgi:gliding motility-associated-like protein
LQITLEPLQNVNAIQIGAPCGAIPAEYSFGTMLLMFPYLLYDHFSLIGSQPVVLDSIQVNGSWCSEDLELSVDPPGNVQASQWFYEGVAIPGATGTSLDISASGLPPGEYQFVCWSGEECAQEIITVEAIDLPVLEPVVIIDNCAPAPIHMSIPGIPANAVATWTISDGEIIAEAEASHVLEYPGTYSITLDILYGNGCSMTEVISDIMIQSGPIAAFDHSIMFDVVGNTILYASDASIGDIVESEWHLDHGTAVEGLSGPYATFDLGADPVPPGYLTMIVTDVQGCTDTSTHAIHWQLPIAIHAPNSFTPNHDGVNDEWGPIIAGNNEVIKEVSIYDRWGTMIWTTSDPNEHWNGTIKGNSCPTGVYSWMIDIEGNASEGKKGLQGHVTLIR